MNLDWIAQQQPQMEVWLERLVNINSYTENLAGLNAMAEELRAAFLSLGATVRSIPLPPRIRIDDQGSRSEQPLGEALHFVKRGEAPFRLLLCGHMDTVYPPTSPFQKAERFGQRLRGPGAADMKGGLVILLTVLQALEASPLTSKIGWEVLLNPDEEISSVGSRHLLAECASRTHVGLVFEPAFSDGSFASSRKGTATFTIVARGKSAHAGRDFTKGQNAITALAKFILQAAALTDLEKGTFVNVGHVQGGQAVNVVPDLAICRLNVRFNTLEELERVRSSWQGVEIYEDALTPPKPFDEPLFNLLKECGQELGLPIQWQPSGGACDGNRLQAFGLPTIDTLGVVGGHLHTPEEYAELPSLSERARLAAFFIEKLI